MKRPKISVFFQLSDAPALLSLTSKPEQPRPKQVQEGDAGTVGHYTADEVSHLGHTTSRLRLSHCAIGIAWLIRGSHRGPELQLVNSSSSESRILRLGGIC